MAELLRAPFVSGLSGLQFQSGRRAMRILNIAIVAATLLVPSVGHPQDSGRVGGLIGPNLDSTVPAPPAGSQSGLQPPAEGSPSPAQSFIGYPAQPGGQAPANTVTTPAEGGMVSGLVNGHNVIIDPTTGVIMRVLN
jgi:hypothetical protein